MSHSVKVYFEQIVELVDMVEFNTKAYRKEYDKVYRLIDRGLFPDLIVKYFISLFTADLSCPITISKFNLVVLKFCLFHKVHIAVLKNSIEFYFPELGEARRYESNNKKELQDLYTAMCESGIFEYYYITVSDVSNTSEIKEIQEATSYICGHYVLPAMLTIAYDNDEARRGGCYHPTKRIKRAYALLDLITTAGIRFELVEGKLCRVCGKKNKNREGRDDIDITEGMYFAIMRARLEHKYPDGLFNTIS